MFRFFAAKQLGIPVIPGAAQRRPGIQAPDEIRWIPAFAGMTRKNLNIE